MSTPRTIPALLEEGARKFGDHLAVVDGERTMSYAVLADRVRAAARAYLASGVKPGDRVAIWAPNTVDFIVALLGTHVMGAVVVPLNSRYRGHEARVILERSRASALVVANGFLGADHLGMLVASAPAGARSEAVAGPIPGLPHLHTLVDLTDGDDPRARRWTDFLAAGGSVSDEELATAEAGVTPDTVCDILFTSGTTGAPKGVMSAHRQTVGVAQVWAAGAGLTQADRYAIVNPFFHSFGYKAGIIAALTSGTTIHPVLTFDPVALMELIERERISVLPGAPTIFLQFAPRRR